MNSNNNSNSSSEGRERKNKYGCWQQNEPFKNKSIRYNNIPLAPKPRPVFASIEKVKLFIMQEIKKLKTEMNVLKAIVSEKEVLKKKKGKTQMSTPTTPKSKISTSTVSTSTWSTTQPKSTFPQSSPSSFKPSSSTSLQTGAATTMDPDWAEALKIWQEPEIVTIEKKVTFLMKPFMPYGPDSPPLPLKVEELVNGLMKRRQEILDQDQLKKEINEKEKEKNEKEKKLRVDRIDERVTDILDPFMPIGLNSPPLPEDVQKELASLMNEREEILDPRKETNEKEKKEVEKDLKKRKYDSWTGEAPKMMLEWAKSNEKNKKKKKKKKKQEKKYKRPKFLDGFDELERLVDSTDSSD